MDQRISTRTPPYLDATFQIGLITSVLIALVVGYLYWSFKKMVIGYAVGIFVTVAILVPDWAFFSRPVSEWTVFMPTDARSKALQDAQHAEMKKTAKYARRDDIHPFGMMFLCVILTLCGYFTWVFITS